MTTPPASRSANEDVSTDVAAPSRDAELGAVLFTREHIAQRVAELGSQISHDYAASVPVLITVLKAATFFLSDLTRQLTIAHELDFLALDPLDGDPSQQQASVAKDLQIPIAGRDVILVKDVVDTGLTLRFLRRWLANHEPASIEVVTLLDRPQRRVDPEPIRYRAFTAGDGYVVGYGFDHRERWRNLPDIVELNPLTSR